MANPFAAAAEEVTRGSAPSGFKTEEQVTWYGDLGWRTLNGPEESPARVRSYEELVYVGFRSNPVVGRCVREIVSSLSEAPIYAYRQVDDDKFERIVGHPAEETLNFPNKRDAGSIMLEKMGQHYLIGGNTYLRKIRQNSGRVVGLVPIRPDLITGADVDDDEFPVFYKKRTKDFKTERISAEDIVHIPDIDPLNAVFGMPRLLSAYAEVTTDNEASAYVGETLGNHGTPGTVVAVDKGVTQAQIVTAEQRWRSKFGPRRGRGKVAFVPGGHTLTNLGFSLRDLEFPDLRVITRESICAVFGVDPMLIGLGSSARQGTLSGKEHEIALRKLWVQILIPMIRRWEAVLNLQLAPEWGEIFLFFALEEIVALLEDRTEAFNRSKLMADTGGFTEKEIRTEAGFDPDPAPEDNSPIIRPKRLLAVEQDLDGVVEPPPEPPAAPPTEDEPEAEEDEESATRGATKPEQKDDGTAGKEGGISVPFVLSGDWPVRQEGWDQVEAWRQFDAFARAWEALYDVSVSRQFANERLEVTTLASGVLRDHDISGTRSVKQGPIDEESLAEFERRLGRLFDSYHQQWKDRFTSLVESQTEVVTAGLAGSIGMSLNTRHPMMREFLEDHVNRLVGTPIWRDGDVVGVTPGIPGQTWSAIITAVQQGLENGDDTTKIAARIRAVFDEGYYRFSETQQRYIQVLSAAQRSRLIARTESTTIANGAAWTQMKTTGLRWWKEWLTQQDDRVRETHVELEGEIVDLELEFSNGLQFPQEPNCRCTLAFEIKDPEDEDLARPA